MTPHQRPRADRRSGPPQPAGLSARRLAIDALDRVLRQGASLEEAFESAPAKMEPRDRALAFRIVATALRRLGTLRAVLAGLLDKGVPKSAPQVESVLLVGATQLLFMDVADHAAVSLSVESVRGDRAMAGFSGLINGVLRRLARERDERLAAIDPLEADTPFWLRRRWSAAYGEEAARAIARAHGEEPALDLTVKSDPEKWAQALSGEVLPTGTVRVLNAGPVPALPGFSEGEWWVQDAAAALPARLLGDVAGRRVADLCAAPGGKTAQLAASGGIVTAVDRSGARLERLRENLKRLRLSADVVEADAATYTADPFDAVLLDAPCTATGTLRRHPDIAWGKRESDVTALAELQAQLLAHAGDLVKPGGRLVYSTCSLEQEEGEAQIARFLAARPDFARSPIVPGEIAGTEAFLTPQGDLRTLPCHWQRGEPARSGLDGFFAARLVRAG